MTWRFLFVFVVLMLVASAAAGVALGNWLVDQAPRLTAEPRTNVATLTEPVLDASGRPLALVAPQPRLDGTLGEPIQTLAPMWEIEPISLFETNLDPMVVLGRGDDSYSVADMLARAGLGLPGGDGDIATVDLTADSPEPLEPQEQAARVQPVTEAPMSWRDQLQDAIDACAQVGFFSRPGCIDKARQKFCAPNQAWGRDPLCPSPLGVTN